MTLFNDLAILAPPALLDPALRWAPVHPLAVRATLTRGAETVSAVLEFNEAGELVDFVSDDRMQASPDGTRFTARRWSTPLRAYRAFGARRLASHGEARWHAPEAAFVYIELDLIDVAYNQAP